MKGRGILAMVCLLLGAGTVSAACDEVGYIATFYVAEGKERAFEEAIVKLAVKVMEVEEGAILYAPYKGEQGRYYMMERYQNLEARNVHATAPEVLELFGPVSETLSAPVDVEAVSAVCAP